MIIRAKAPLRLSFAGGGTDVSPYPENYGGAVLSTTIDKYAYASLGVREDREIHVRSLDYDIVAKYDVGTALQYDGNLDLVKAVLQAVGVTRQSHGLDLYLHADAPPGTGLGSSSALVVAMLGAFAHWLRLPVAGYELAELAYRIERSELNIVGGRQDQYAATFGGFNFIEFDSRTTVNALRVPQAVVNELHYRLLLCYTGRARQSDAGIIDTQVHRCRQGDTDMLDALQHQKKLASELKRLLLHGRLDEFGERLHDAWQQKKRFAKAITAPHIDEMYDAARAKGALGGKMTGAGGGGYMLFYCQFGTRHLVAAELERLGGQLVDFNFESGGLQTWNVTSVVAGSALTEFTKATQRSTATRAEG